MSAQATEPTVGRTDIDVAADTVVALIHAQLLRGDNASIGRAAEAAGLMAGEVFTALSRRKQRGWQPPRRVMLDDDAPAEEGPPLQTVDSQSPANREKFSRANPEPGKRRCCRCKGVKPVGAFNIRNKKTGNRASMCKLCAVDYARERYLSVGKVSALNAAAVMFTVSDADDVIGLACSDCGTPIVAGQRVHGETELRHTTCPVVQ